MMKVAAVEWNAVHFLSIRGRSGDAVYTHNPALERCTEHSH